MNYNDDSVHIGVKKRKPKPDHISHIIEAMPIPSAWNISQPVAKGKGNLRLTKGVIRFVKLDISIADRLPRETQEYVPDVSPVDFDPADRILKITNQWLWC